MIFLTKTTLRFSIFGSFVQVSTDILDFRKSVAKLMSANGVTLLQHDDQGEDPEFPSRNETIVRPNSDADNVLPERFVTSIKKHDLANINDKKSEKNVKNNSPPVKSSKEYLSDNVSGVSMNTTESTTSDSVSI